MPFSLVASQRVCAKTAADARLREANQSGEGRIDCFVARTPRNDRRLYRPHTSPATSTASFSLAHCSSSVRMLPSSVEAKPHCGDSGSCSSGAYLEASASRRLMSSFFSSSPLLEVMTPTTTILLPLGRNRSGSKAPGRPGTYFGEQPRQL